MNGTVQLILTIVAIVCLAQAYVLRPAFALICLLALSSSSNDEAQAVKPELWGVIWKPYVFLVVVALGVMIWEMVR